MLLHGGLQRSRFRPMHVTLVPDKKIVAREFVGLTLATLRASSVIIATTADAGAAASAMSAMVMSEHSKAPLQLRLWGNRQCSARCLYFLLLHRNKSNRTEMVAVEFILGVVGTPRNTGSLIPDFS